MCFGPAFIIAAVLTGARSRASYGSNPAPRVGFYGCANRLVRLTFIEGQEPSTPRGYPHHLELSCPACGHEHVIAPVWRVIVERDAGMPSDIELGQELARA